jgi:hypothetical protein
MYISKELEEEATDKVIRGLLWVMGMRWKEWETEDVLVVCVSPDYSGMIGLRVLHGLSKGREFPNYAVADVPFPDSDEEVIDECKLEFRLLLGKWRNRVSRIILVEAGVLTGGNYTWMTRMIEEFGFDKPITVALIQREDSKFDCDVIGDYSSGMPTFWWEEDNKHWDGII